VHTCSRSTISSCVINPSSRCRVNSTMKFPGTVVAGCGCVANFIPASPLLRAAPAGANLTPTTDAAGSSLVGRGGANTRYSACRFRREAATSSAAGRIPSVTPSSAESILSLRSPDPGFQVPSA
jgi:hypothetical protein